MMDVSRQRFQTHDGTYEFGLKDERIPFEYVIPIISNERSQVSGSL